MKSPESERRPDPALVEPLFHEAAALPPAEQDAFLAGACGSDEPLRKAVRTLLENARSLAPVWEGTAMQLEARSSALACRTAQPGEFFGRYRILRRIATGGMSFVYEAIRDDAEFQKRVAIKFLHQGIDEPAALERFRSERQILAQLEHRSIAHLLDGGTTADGIPYLVMEYVDGAPIDRFAADHGLSRTDRLRLWLQVCEAVEYAHRNLVVHRDLKPANVLVTPDAEPKLLDFGIARILTGDAHASSATVQALTPEYASPEQVLGHSIGTASDIYSLGVLLFVMLAGRLPYRADGSRPAELLRAICEEAPVWEPPGLIAADLRSILAKALDKKPERRYHTAEEFDADVRRYLDGLPVLARPATIVYRARKFVVRRAIPLAAAGAVLVALAAGGIAALVQSRRAERRFNDVRILARSILFEVYDSIAGLPGSLDARRLLAGRAQRYLDDLARDAGNDPALALELAESYMRLGDVRGAPYAANLGDTAGALESYRKALQILEREAARHPDDLSILPLLARTCGSVGGILARQKNPDAVALMRRSVALDETLCARYPHDLTYRLDLSRSYLGLGAALRSAPGTAVTKAGLEAVLAAYRKSLEIQEATGPSPDVRWQTRLAPKYFYVGYALRDLGDLTGDVSYYRQALASSLRGDALYRAVAAANPVQNNLRNVADGLADIGILRWKCSHGLAASLSDLHDALRRFQSLAAADPRNLEARRDLADTFQKIGLVMAEAGRPPAALEADRKALAIYEELEHADPASRENADHIAAVRNRIASLEARGAAR